MRIKNIKQKDIVKKTRIGSATISRLLSDDTANPTIDTLNELAKLFEVNVAQLIGESPLSTKIVDPKNIPQSSIPLLNFTTVGAFIAHNEIPENCERVTTDMEISELLFAIKMNDDSMKPLFPNGTTLIFKKSETFKDYSYVLVEISGNYVIKQLILDPPNLFIRSINPDIAISSLTKLENKQTLRAILVQAKYSFI